MKNIIVFYCLIFSSYMVAYSQNLTMKTLIGKWEGIDPRGNNGVLEFFDSTKVIITMDNLIAQGAFKVDFGKTPIPLEIMTEQPGQKKEVQKSTIYFIDKNTIRWQIASGGNSVDKKETTMLLKRRED